MVKKKINLSSSIDVDHVLSQIAAKYENENIDYVDGIRIDFSKSWVQLRKSNTEPIIRVYSEATSEERAKSLILNIESLVHEISN
jgi:phosphomannomutase